MKQIGSVITGLPKPARTGASSTGGRRGETGVATLSNGAPSHPAPMAEPEAVTGDLLTRLKSETGFSVSLRKRRMFPPEGGSYEVLESVEVHSAPNFDQDAAIALCREYSAPADLRSRIDLATMLKVACKARGEGEEMTAAQLKFYADALGRYPADVARKVVMRWVETKVFFPALSELHDACKREVQGRDRIEAAIRKRYLEEETIGDFIPMPKGLTPEQIAAIKAKVDEEFSV